MISYLSNNKELPGIHSSESIAGCHPIVFVDSDWRADRKITLLQESSRCHISYISSPNLLAWSMSDKINFFHQMKENYVSTEYLKSQLIHLAGASLKVLNYPVSEEVYKPAREKRKQIVCIGDTLEDNIDGLRDTLRFLKLDWDIIILPSDSNEIPDALSESWAYVSMSRNSHTQYDLIRAGLSSCFVFIWSYLAHADAYRVHRFEDDVDFVEMINKTYNNMEGKPNKDIRSYMMERHGLVTFEKNIKSIINNLIF